MTYAHFHSGEASPTIDAPLICFVEGRLATQAAQLSRIPLDCSGSGSRCRERAAWRQAPHKHSDARFLRRIRAGNELGGWNGHSDLWPAVAGRTPIRLGCERSRAEQRLPCMASNQVLTYGCGSNLCGVSSVRIPSNSWQLAMGTTWHRCRVRWFRGRGNECCRRGT